MWTLEEALTWIKRLEQYATETGWHFALTGGILRNGKSDHDLDIIAYPRKTFKADRAQLRFMLKRFGWWQRMTAKELQGHWKKKGNKDRKHVEVWETFQGKRVDLFILGDNPGWFGVK